LAEEEMKIVLDLTSLCRAQTGMEYYALNLARALLEADGGNEYHLLFRSEVHPELQAFSNRACFHLSPLDKQIAAEQAWIPVIERKIKPDVSHFPAFPPGLFSRGKKISTLFDATLWKNKNRLSWKAKTYLAPLTSRAARRAEKILTISENAKAEIAQAARVSEQKFTVTPLAPDPIFLEPMAAQQKQSVREKYRLPERFILSVATMEPRKNLTGLLCAFARMVDGEPEARLVLAGRLAWGKEAVLQTVNKLKLEKHTQVLGYVPKEDLPALYALADFLAFPSFYEGFGLPVLEAQAAGTPVLCSNTSSFPEVAGTSAFFVDPHSAEELAAGLQKLWSDSALRQNLIAKGNENLKRFSWEKTARRTLQAYAEVFYA
jgi:glycosyltransferase involved in cell wall biosynthesis